MGVSHPPLRAPRVGPAGAAIGQPSQESPAVFAAAAMSRFRRTFARADARSSALNCTTDPSSQRFASAMCPRSPVAFQRSRRA